MKFTALVLIGLCAGVVGAIVIVDDHAGFDAERMALKDAAGCVSTLRKLPHQAWVLRVAGCILPVLNPAPFVSRHTCL